MRQNLSHNLYDIGIFGVAPDGETSLEGYTHHIPHVCVQSNQVKDIRQDVK